MSITTAFAAQEQSGVGQETLAMVRDSARHLTGIISVLPTLYFAVISFSEVRRIVHGPLALIFLAPMLPWLVGTLIVVAIQLPTTLPAGSPDAQASARKQLQWLYYRRLQWAYWCLVGGLTLVVAVFGYYLMLPSVP